MRRIPAGAALAAIVAVAAALHGLAASRVQGPWISPDETVYALLGQSLYRHASLTILGGPTPFYSLVVPAIVGPFLSLHDLGLGYSLLKPELAVVMSLAAVPVYFWTRALAGRGWALAAAALTVAAPGLAYSGLVMSEVVFYPVMTLAAWTAARAIAVPTRARVVVVALTVALALLTRLQALVLLPAIVGAVALDAAFARSPARLRQTAAVAAGACAPVVVWFAFQQIRGEPALGAYESTTAAGYQARDVARWILYHAGGLVLTTGVLPVCALLVLAVAAALNGERDPLGRSTIAVTLALAGCVVVQVGVFASQHVGQLAERDVLCVVPSLLTCFVLWVARGSTVGYRWRLVVAGATLALLSALPLREIVTYRALFDSITLAPLWHLRDAVSARALVVAVLVGAVAAAAAFVFAPPRMRVLLPFLLLALGIAGSVSSAREVIDQAHRTRLALVGGFPRWIDAAAHGDSATYVYDGGRDWPAVWQALFWNRSVRHVAILGSAALPGPAPQRPLGLRGDGRISVADAAVIMPSSYTAHGTEVASVEQTIPGQEGLRLWHLEPPPRIATRILGVQAAGDIYAHEPATLEAFGCSRGIWGLTLLVKQRPQSIVISQNGRVIRRLRFGPTGPPNEPWHGELRSAPRPGTQICTLKILPTGLTGSTRLEFVPQTAS